MNSKEAKDDAKLRQLLGNETTHSENMHHASTWRRHRKETRMCHVDNLFKNSVQII